jgi:hypothetical protein
MLSPSDPARDTAPPSHGARETDFASAACVGCGGRVDRIAGIADQEVHTKSECILARLMGPGQVDFT